MENGIDQKIIGQAHTHQTNTMQLHKHNAIAQKQSNHEHLSC